MAKTMKTYRYEGPSPSRTVYDGGKRVTLKRGDSVELSKEVGDDLVKVGVLKAATQPAKSAEKPEG